MISRSKMEHILCLFLNGLNIVLYIFIIIAIVFKCKQDKRFGDITVGIYTIVLALLLIVNELKEFAISTKYLCFLATYKGRGLLIAFFGCLVLNTGVINITVGTLVLVVGIIYVIIPHLSPVFPPPHPITVNWRNWKDYSAEGLDLPNPRHQHPQQPFMTDIREVLKSPAPRSSSAVGQQ
ncbi:COPI associated protein-domain-containing protein [Mycotypha africana]|uniref:COPI associated protein-domain-containing protein n=1 Tax=Mycotypha africana TaxID=64632 RepID=UPI002300FDD7|nr:COPI associated protein-domain-containing protein [Mycotypha africana]KAI8977555.1 COPI associated protein-domain-containing protein [Mycotypha africana]